MTTYFNPALHMFLTTVLNCSHQHVLNGYTTLHDEYEGRWGDHEYIVIVFDSGEIRFQCEEGYVAAVPGDPLSVGRWITAMCCHSECCRTEGCVVHNQRPETAPAPK